MPTVANEITHVSDTALLVAGCRAIETERPDAFVRDPFAARLAGERGIAMFRAVPHPEIMGFGLAIRTRFIDELLCEALASWPISTVACLGAGLDTRPWRLDLPPDLRWVEVDFPAMLEYKESLLAGETPRCRRERLTADLNDPAQRRAIYAALGTGRTLLITEGLLMYLPSATVGAIAAGFQSESSVAYWICDVTTSAFSKAIGGGGTTFVRHVQAEDHLEGEQILETIYAHGWATEARRSYISDLGFATDRINRMFAALPKPPTPPPFAPNEPSGVHRFIPKADVVRRVPASDETKLAS